MIKANDPFYVSLTQSPFLKLIGFPAPNNNLCIYFWQVVIAHLLIPVVVGWVVATTIAFPFFLFFGELGGKYYFIPGMFVWAIIVIIMLALIGDAIEYLVKKVFKWTLRGHINDGWKSLDIVPQYIKARKEKFCPTLVFEADIIKEKEE